MTVLAVEGSKRMSTFNTPSFNSFLHDLRNHSYFGVLDEFQIGLFLIRNRTTS
jgi:hypothetical protein